MSSRVTRSSARLAADPLTATASISNTSANPAQPTSRSRKRKAPAPREQSPEEAVSAAKVITPRRAKRQKVAPLAPTPPPAPVPKSRRRHIPGPTAMAHPDSSSGAGGIDNAPPVKQESSRRKSGRNKKIPPEPEPPSSLPPTSANRRSKKAVAKKTEDIAIKDADDISKINPKHTESASRNGDISEEDDDDEDGPGGRRGYVEEDDDADDPFRGSFLGHDGSASGISNTLRALSGMVSGVSARLREILNNLRQKDDPSIQLIALQELSEILLVSTEDNLSGHFSPDQFVKELVTLMQPSEFGEENPEMMLLACRCIANLMEALPPSTANVVYGGAVPILCQKLLEIHFIDLAEQALSTLEKISVEFPSSIVREGGLTACLTYLDFFATSTQRVAVTTAANCCRNIPQDSFPVIRDVMPILLNVLGSNDQKVVEQGSLCVSRVVESFKYQQDKLEELISADLLRAIRRLLLPGTTNLIGPSIYTQFLRVLATTARASPTLSAELFKMNIVDTIYQILTGVSPPSGVEDIASQIDSVVVMQALIHRPREQIYETLNVICELLPGIHGDGLSFHDVVFASGFAADDLMTISEYNSATATSPNVKRIEFMKDCKEELKRFAIVLLPTLTDAYSSTVNLGVRQKVLTAQLKMLSNLDTSILEEALRTVPYASYLASILSQQDHPSLVTFALQAAELLLSRMGSIYRYQFYREGVMAEIQKLASQPSKSLDQKLKAVKADPDADSSMAMDAPQVKSLDQNNQKAGQDEPSDEDNDPDDDDDDDEDERSHVHPDISPSPSESSSSEQNDAAQTLSSRLQDYITRRAKGLLNTHEDEKGTGLRDKAVAILNELKTLAKDIEASYFSDGSGNGTELFTRLSRHFDGDALESITSSELLHSEVVQVLLDVFNNPDEGLKANARKAFLEVFMNAPPENTPKSQGMKNFPTPFSVLVHKLQDLLSRAEHFEVITVHHNALDSNRSSTASMLSKQVRLKLVADDEAEMPRAYRNLIISIHAIATFKALDDYLRPRISLSERPRGSRQREGVSNALAAFAAAAGLPAPQHRRTEGGEASGGEPLAPVTPSNVHTTGRGARIALKTKNGSAAPDITSVKEKSTNVRRSSRRQQPAAQASSEAAVKAPGRAQTPLECADERQLTDEEDIDDSNALDAIVDDLEDGMDVENSPDPAAIDMEVTPTGKVTARKEDGTRISSPSQLLASVNASLSSRTRELLAAGVNPSAAGRAMMSYAAALQAPPQDWHLEFSIDGRPVPNDTTIYGAVHSILSQTTGNSPRSMWSALHVVKFKRVPGPPSQESSSLVPPLEASSESMSSRMPTSLHEHPTTSNILRLLNILHELNANLDDVLDDNKEMITLNTEPLAQFINTKLTAKLNRQLEEPLIVASKCLPRWSEDLPRLYPFLFPFETRHLFLQSTSFGYMRSLSRWQSTQSLDEARRDRHREDRPFLPKLQRQKVRISRTRILESAIKVMELYGASPSVLEVEYFEEVGTGLGPTLEFYSTVSKEFSKKKVNLWRQNDANPDDEYAFGKLGLFPAPMSLEQAETEAGKKTLHLFKMLGKFIARSMLDSRIIDVSLNPTFFRIGDYPSAVPLSLGSVKTVDSHLARSLMLVKKFASAKKQIDQYMKYTALQKTRAAAEVEVDGVCIESLGLDFTLPGYPAIELVKDGANVAVTMDNVATYVERVIDMTLGSGVQKQVDAFKAGFSQVFPYPALTAFTPNELVMLFGRVDEDWTLETLLDSIKADHGFNMDSKSVRNLLQTMSELSPSQRRNFLQFVTGSPKLPIGGFKSLTPMFTVVCKPSEPPYTSDDFLISVMTCANYVKLPDYSNIDILRKRLMTAIEEGQGAFHLS